MGDLKECGRVGRHSHVAGRCRLIQSGCKRHRAETRDECDDAEVLRIKAEGWAVLADAQVDPLVSHLIIPMRVRRPQSKHLRMYIAYPYRHSHA